MAIRADESSKKESFKTCAELCITRQIVAAIQRANRQKHQILNESVSLNPSSSMGELIGNAALNTLIGMGTVFIVLILISLIISCFNFIPKIQAKFAKRPKKEEVKSAAVDNTIAQIIEKEELSDDLELVAVIAAAIAASEGASSTDGFVVRSIKRAGNKWQRA